MKHHVRGLATSFVLLLTGVTACGQGPTSATTPSSVLTEMRNEEGTHHDACIASTSATDERDETGRYAGNMSSLSDDMLAACNSMMRTGDATEAQVNDINDMRDRMRTAIADHQARIDALSDMASIHTECDAHHAAMIDLFDKTGTDLPSGTGMMGGGSMM